jgi:hypothetical protein
MRERPILFSAPSHAHGEDGFWSRVDKSGGPDACWPWLGAVNAKGYGRRHLRGRLTLAHRAAHLFSKGEIPEGFTVDHLCRNRRCQNPLHLEAVPHRVNLLRGNTITAKSAATVACPRGHAYDVSNTAHRSGHRVCKTCDRARSARSYVRTSTRKTRGWLSDAEKTSIKAMIGCGQSHSQIATAMSVSVATVSRVRNS